MRVALVGRTGDRDDGRAGREQGIEQGPGDGLFLKIEHDELGGLCVREAPGEDGVAQGLEPNRVEPALDQLGAQRRARAPLCADDPDLQCVSASPCITDARIASRPSGSRRMTYVDVSSPISSPSAAR